MFLLPSIIQLFPKELALQLHNLIPPLKGAVEEVRIRKNYPLVLRGTDWDQPIGSTCITEAQMMHMVLTASNGSLHTVTEYLKQGYLPLNGGCRMGICGEGIYQNGAYTGIRNISSLCIRIAAEIKGCADDIFPTLTSPRFDSTLLISPPGGGKTTLLRELIRKLSEFGYYVSVADERGEVSGISCGDVHFDLGPRCDVSFGIDKCTAAMQMLRTMSPDIIAMDEITAEKDIPAITMAMDSGVKLLATIHGSDLSVLNTPRLRSVDAFQAFRYAVILTHEHGRRKTKLEILNE